MSHTTGWLPTEAFAKLANITPQAARKALRAGIRGDAWRGHALVVRHRLGPGGRGGLGYEVAFESLPEKFRRKSEDAPGDLAVAPTGANRRTVDNQGQLVGSRWQAIAEALALPARSTTRSAAIVEAAIRSGRSERTLYRWIDQYERHGMRGLARVRSLAANAPRVVVSRTFDRAFYSSGYSDDVLIEIAAALEKALKGLWASRAEQAGATEVRRLAEFLLLEACQVRGLAIDPGAIRLSRRAVERFAHYRVDNQRRNDRKAFDDAKPRIRRLWTDLTPMERVVADVKHLDVIVRRPDGSPAWPKIVASMDAGTGRVFVHPVLLERGEGVRQEHVIEALLAMVSDPAWGFPQGLYLDNGSEFAALTKIDSALQMLGDPGARTIIFARPYNAAAKPIESLFAGHSSATDRTPIWHRLHLGCPTRKAENDVKNPPGPRKKRELVTISTRQ